ncbi:MAG: hypothetical protein ABI759_24720 [Candidatus Solibacter sp.]
MKTFLSLILAVVPGILHAQGAEGIHAPASRSITLPVEEAKFQVMISASLETTAQQVKRSLQEAGAPDPTVVLIALGPSFERVSGPPLATFSATFTIAAGASTTLVKSLVDLRGHLAAPLVSLNFGVSYGAAAATVEAARQAMLPQLVEASHATAQMLAAASGVKLGAIRATNEGGAVYANASRVGAIIGGDFSGLIQTQPSSTKYTFSLELVFATLP